MSLQLEVVVTEPDAGHLAGADVVLVNGLAVPRQVTLSGAAVAVAVVEAVNPPTVNAAADRTPRARERMPCPLLRRQFRRTVNAKWGIVLHPDPF
jgi:hypothetical protein